MKKLKKHRKVEKDYEKLKSKHLERLATEILKKDEINLKLKSKIINTNFLDNF
jgi:hypothetical protein